jgi:hypothetical protein
MVSPQGTSFIPQRPAHGKAASRKVRKIYVLAYLSYVLFFGALISAGIVFFLGFSLNAQLAERQKQLATERELFNQGDIESIRDLEKRINLARERLDNHVSVLAILEALERSAVQSLAFSGLTYEREGDEFPLVTFSGSSQQFNNILFQREVLSTNPILAGSTFNEVSVDASKTEGQEASSVIQFTLEKKVDTSLIGYTPRTNNSQDSQNSGNSQDSQEIQANDQTSSGDGSESSGGSDGSSEEGESEDGASGSDQ